MGDIKGEIRWRRRVSELLHRPKGGVFRREVVVRSRNLTTQKDTALEIMGDLCYVNFSRVGRPGTRFQGSERYTREEKPVTQENATKKLDCETKAREREVTGRDSVTLGKENACTHL